MFRLILPTDFAMVPVVTLPQVIEALIEVRKRRNVQAVAVARQMGVSKGRFNNWERNGNVPKTWELLEAWAAALGLRVLCVLQERQVSPVGMHMRSAFNRLPDDMKPDVVRYANLLPRLSHRDRRMLLRYLDGLESELAEAQTSQEA